MNRADFLRDGLRLKVRSRACGILPNTERREIYKTWWMVGLAEQIGALVQPEKDQISGSVLTPFGRK